MAQLVSPGTGLWFITRGGRRPWLLRLSFCVDAGRTELHGVPTPTCGAIGPDFPDRIDPITGLLKLQLIDGRGDAVRAASLPLGPSPFPFLPRQQDGVPPPPGGTIVVPIPHPTAKFSSSASCT